MYSRSASEDSYRHMTEDSDMADSSLPTGRRTPVDNRRHMAVVYQLV